MALASPVSGRHEGTEGACRQFQPHKENGHLYHQCGSLNLNILLLPTKKQGDNMPTLLAYLDTGFTCFWKQTNISTSPKLSHMPWKQCTWNSAWWWRQQRDLWYWISVTQHQEQSWPEPPHAPGLWSSSVLPIAGCAEVAPRWPCGAWSCDFLCGFGVCHLLNLPQKGSQRLGF